MSRPGPVESPGIPLPSLMFRRVKVPCVHFLDPAVGSGVPLLTEAPRGPVLGALAHFPLFSHTLMTAI